MADGNVAVLGKRHRVRAKAAAGAFARPDDAAGWEAYPATGRLAHLLLLAVLGLVVLALVAGSIAVLTSGVAMWAKAGVAVIWGLNLLFAVRFRSA
jgi:hypothetical protein